MTENISSGILCFTLPIHHCFHQALSHVSICLVLLDRCLIHAWQISGTCVTWMVTACQMFWAAWKAMVKHLPSKYQAVNKWLVLDWHLFDRCLIVACQAITKHVSCKCQTSVKPVSSIYMYQEAPSKLKVLRGNDGVHVPLTVKYAGHMNFFPSCTHPLQTFYP